MMNYGFLLTGDLSVARLTTALAELATVPETAVSVAPENTEHARGATVFGTYAPAGGDITWSLDVYFADAPATLDEEQVARHLAARLGQPVLYSAQSFPPSAHWLAMPDGGRTRARLYEGDDEDAVELTVDAVEQPVPTLPHVRVEAQPEVIREHRMPTPTTDEIKAGYAADIVDSLGVWEALVARMTAGWPPDGWYPESYFQEDLRARDRLAAELRRLPPSAAAAVETALVRIDGAFRAGTVESTGGPDDAGWWWHRRPDPVPWQAGP